MKANEIPHTTATNVSKIVLSEKQTKITFNNSNPPKWILKTQIDGGMYPQGGSAPRCDYKLEHYQGNKDNAQAIIEEYKNTPKNGKQIFVELKGKNVKHAIEQLEASIPVFNNKMEGNKAYVVYTSFPKTDVNKQLEIKKFKTKYKISLDFVNSGGTRDI